MISKIIGILKSIKLAVILIFIISVLSLSGVFIPQVPSELTISPDAYNWWLENIAQVKFGDFTDIIGKLGLFNIFHSIGFIASIFLLMLNIFICSLNRSRSLTARFEKARMNKNIAFYTQGKQKTVIESILPIGSVIKSMNGILKKLHYSISQSKSDSDMFFAGDKYRFSEFGTYAVHLSLFIFIFGILLGNISGFRNNTFMVMENNIQDIGYNTGLSIYLKSFTDDYWPDGTPKDYRSDIILYDNGLEVKSGSIRVNHPMIYNGIRFHQSFFGPAIKLKITDSEDNMIFDGDIALIGTRTNNSLQRPEGNIKLPDNDYSVFLIGNAENGFDPYIDEDEIGVELYDPDMNLIAWIKLEKDVKQTLGDLDFIFTDKLQYSGLIISKDPGSIFIWTASFLFIIGLGMIFYFPHRQIWIALFSNLKEGTIIAIKLGSMKEFGLEKEFDEIISEWKKI
jgi:cytochrome c biogenesis protein